MQFNSLLAIFHLFYIAFIKTWFALCSDFEVDYESEKKASIVYKALVVDKEVLLDDINLHLVPPELTCF